MFFLHCSDCSAISYRAVEMLCGSLSLKSLKSFTNGGLPSFRSTRLPWARPQSWLGAAVLTDVLRSAPLSISVRQMHRTQVKIHWLFIDGHRLYLQTLLIFFLFDTLVGKCSTRLLGFSHRTYIATADSSAEIASPSFFSWEQFIASEFWKALEDRLSSYR